MDSIKTTKRILKHSNLTAKILAVESHFVAGYIVKECINMSLVQKLEKRRAGRLFIKQLKRTKIKMGEISESKFSQLYTFLCFSCKFKWNFQS